jgi:hypothetical protein
MYEYDPMRLSELRSNLDPSPDEVQKESDRAEADARETFWVMSFVMLPFFAAASAFLVWMASGAEMKWTMKAIASRVAVSVPLSLGVSWLLSWKAAAHEFGDKYPGYRIRPWRLRLQF